MNIKYSVFDSAYPNPMGIKYSKKRAIAMKRRIEEVFNRKAFIKITTPAIKKEQENLIKKIESYHKSLCTNNL